jgi:methylated-DNA-[protein]-cysteine S-methyltransferase
MTDAVTWTLTEEESNGFGVQLTCTPNGVVAVRFAVPRGREAAGEAAAGRRFGRRQPWFPRLVEDVQAYLYGQAVDLSVYPVDLTNQPPFRRRVQEACRLVPYGQTTSYAALAARAGNPLAVRAAGSAMRHNPVPLLVPCHRVLHRDGGLGGFSAPGGSNLKERLLALERAGT